jgi:hypothetical protein
LHFRVLFLNVAGTYSDGSKIQNASKLVQHLLESKFMRDVTELLRAKEQELLKVKRQVEALRIAAPLLGDDDDRVTPSPTQIMSKGNRSLE